MPTDSPPLLPASSAKTTRELPYVAFVLSAASFALVVAALVVAYRSAHRSDAPIMLIGGLVASGCAGILLGAAVGGYAMLLRLRPKWPSRAAVAAIPLVLLVFAALIVRKSML